MFQSKDRESKVVEPVHSERPMSSQVSTLGAGMQITGNIVCNGALQVYGRVKGDIHASQLTICEGAVVEGKVIAQDAVIQGSFNGTVHGNGVKLSKTAKVDGEIFSKSLSIEQDAQFEGVSRKLDKQVDAPSAAADKPAPVLRAVAPQAAVN